MNYHIYLFEFVYTLCTRQTFDGRSQHNIDTNINTVYIRIISNRHRLMRYSPLLVYTDDDGASWCWCRPEANNTDGRQLSAETALFICTERPITVFMLRGPYNHRRWWWWWWPQNPLAPSPENQKWCQTCSLAICARQSRYISRQRYLYRGVMVCVARERRKSLARFPLALTWKHDELLCGMDPVSILMRAMRDW